MPLDRVLAAPDEVTELTCLFELFEEQLDCPSRSVEFGHGPCGPVAVVREEDHSPHLPLTSIIAVTRRSVPSPAVYFPAVPFRDGRTISSPRI